MKLQPKKLSIIVPIYNVEKYLERCIDSLLNQDLEKSEYEIIMVNDGSTDNSYEIAKHFVDGNENIVLLTQENKGLSGARNTGLKAASGEFVIFVDSDDELFPNVVGRLCAFAQKNKLDACAYRMKYCDSLERWHTGSIQPFSPQQIYSGEYAILHGADIGSACIYLYNKTFLDKYSLSFTEGIFHEDVDFNMRMYAFAIRMMFTDVVAYKYNFNPKSIQHECNKEKKLKSYNSEVFIAKHINEFVSSQSFSHALMSFYKTHANSVLVGVLLQMTNDNLLSRKEKLSVLNGMRQKGLYPIIGRTLSYKTTLTKVVLNIEPLFRLILWLKKQREMKEYSD